MREAIILGLMMTAASIDALLQLYGQLRGACKAAYESNRQTTPLTRVRRKASAVKAYSRRGAGAWPR
jgi:hypothetical protein